MQPVKATATPKAPPKEEPSKKDIKSHPIPDLLFDDAFVFEPAPRPIRKFMVTRPKPENIGDVKKEEKKS